MIAHAQGGFLANQAANEKSAQELANIHILASV